MAIAGPYSRELLRRPAALSTSTTELPGFRPEISPEETLARQATTAALQGQLAPGMQRLLSDVATREMARLSGMGILTGGQTFPTVLRAQTERVLYPAYQQAMEQAYGLGQRLWGRQFEPWRIQYGGALQQRLQAEQLAAEREMLAQRLAAEERMRRREMRAQERAAEQAARGQAMAGLWGGAGTFLGALPWGGIARTIGGWLFNE